MKDRINAPLGAVPFLVLGLLTVGIVAAVGISTGARLGRIPSPEVRFPQTPAGRTAEAYFKAFNTGEDAMKGFFEKFAAKDSLLKTPMPARLERYRQMRGRLGSLEPREIIAEHPGSIMISAQAQTGGTVRLDFEFEAAEPHGLLGIRVEATGGGPGDQAPPPDPKKNEAELIGAVRDYALKAVAAGDFSGVILIAKNGAPIFEEAFGEADRERRIPNRTDTKFNIGSINKSFTARPSGSWPRRRSYRSTTPSAASSRTTRTRMPRPASRSANSWT